MSDWIDGLERLKALKDEGHLSDAEFEITKARLLEKAGSDTPREGFADSIGATPQAEPAEYEPYEPDDGVDPPKTWPKVLLGVFALCVAGAGFWLLARPSTAQTRFAEAAYTDVNCRTAPGVDGSVQEIIYKGTQVRLGQSQGDWARIADKGCWVRERNLRIADDQDAAPASAPPAAAPSTAAQASPPAPAAIVPRADSCEIAIIKAASAACEVSMIATFFPAEEEIPGLSDQVSRFDSLR